MIECNTAAVVVEGPGCDPKFLSEWVAAAAKVQAAWDVASEGPDGELYNGVLYGELIHFGHSAVQVRAVVLIALLAVVRKLIIVDLSSTDAFHLLALAAAILALGAVYWLVRDQAGVASVFRAELHDVRYWHKADIA